MTVLVAAPVYGLVIGSHEISGDRLLYAVYAAIKMPMLIAVTAMVCLPGFFVLMTIFRLREDLGWSVRAIMAGQATVSVSLASMAPLIAIFYLSGVSHRWALLLSGAVFAVATVAGQVVMWRWYRVLVSRNQRHLVMLAYWLVMYVFVGIQMGWSLRPFVGSPGVEPSFVRQEPMTNAYVVVYELVVGKRR